MADHGKQQAKYLDILKTQLVPYVDDNLPSRWILQNPIRQRSQAQIQIGGLLQNKS